MSNKAPLNYNCYTEICSIAYNIKLKGDFDINLTAIKKVCYNILSRGAAE